MAGCGASERRSGFTCPVERLKQSAGQRRRGEEEKGRMKEVEEEELKPDKLIKREGSGVTNDAPSWQH